MNSTIAAFDEPSSTVCMPRIWLSGLPFEPDAVEDRADDVEARGLARPDVEDEEPHPLARLGGERILHHAVVRAVEHRMGRLRVAQAVGVEDVDAALRTLRRRLGVELALDDDVFAVGLGRIAVPRLDDDAPYMPEAMCSRIIGVPQWYMKMPG
jgi:hypothetical protein